MRGTNKIFVRRIRSSPTEALTNHKPIDLLDRFSGSMRLGVAWILAIAKLEVGSSTSDRAI